MRDRVTREKCRSCEIKGVRLTPQYQQTLKVEITLEMHLHWF